MQARAYHEPQGDPCGVCLLPRRVHYVRGHEPDCRCGARHRVRYDDRRHRTRLDRRFWVGLDGEGIGRGPHRYVLLAYSDATGERQDSIRDNAGLRTRDCLDFLLSMPHDACVAGYYLGYDYSKILADLPNKALYRLLRPELRRLPASEGGGLSTIRWHDYQLQYVARILRVKKRDRRITIWDVGSFFQTGFVNALEQWNIGTKAEHEYLRSMKAARGVFSVRDDLDTYNGLECRCLASMMTDFEQAHRDVGFNMKSWHGPGATANIALNSIGIAMKRGKIPREINLPALCAYFGGRFEHSAIGEVGDCFAHDVVSAYPYQEYRLPCLEHGTWRHTTREPQQGRALISYSLYDCGNEPWGPLPCRLPNGNIVFGRGGFSGWCWSDEYYAARDHWDGIKFREAYVLESDCMCLPFGKMLEWFELREKFGADGRGRVLKLAYNSCYGKLIQGIGKPRFRSIVWAGMITSGLRAVMLRAIAKHSDRSNVKALATDGLYTSSTISLGEPPLKGSRLGSWKVEPATNLTLVRPGIYWTDESLRARGLGREQLNQHRELVLDAIRRGEEEAHPGMATVFIGARQGIYAHPDGRLKRSKAYGEWIERPVRIRLTPLPKRNPDWSLRMLDGIESAPYKAKHSLQSEVAREIGAMLWEQTA